MNVLELSFDYSLLLASSATGAEARQRQSAYAQELNRRMPGSHLFAIVRTAPGTRAGPAPLSEGVELYPAPSSTLGFVLGAYRLGRQLCRRRGIDLITSQSPFSDGLVALLLKSRGESRWIVQLHTADLDNPHWLAESHANALRALLGKYVLRRADAVRTVSSGAAVWMQQKLGIAQERLFVIPVGTAMVARDAPVSGESTAGSTVLFVGRLAVQKGVSTLLHAFQRVKAERQDAMLVIVGDGPERRCLEELRSKLGLQENTHFMGMLPYERLPERYADAAVVVVPSLYEPYGRVIAEAMAFGRAVVATDTEGARDLLQDGETGLIVPVGDEQALANAICYLLQNPQTARRIGAAAQQFIKRAQDPGALCAAQVEMWLQVASQ